MSPLVDGLGSDESNLLRIMSTEYASGQKGELEEPAWYCVCTKPQREKYAQLHLQRQGYETFLPWLKRKVFSENDFRWAQRPLFPRYLFLRGSLEGRMTALRSTRGVASVVEFGGRPCRVPDSVVQEIQARSTGGEVIVPEETRFQSGDRVRVCTGPYRGMEAIFDRETPDEERVVLLLEIMASVAKLQVDRDFVEAA